MDDFDIFNTDAGTIHNELVDGLQQALEEPLYPGDERRIFADALALVLVAIASKGNDQAKQRHLRYARGAVLDAFGEAFGTYRLEPAKAKTTLRFSLQEARTSPLLIPEGTKATADSEVYFATTAAAVIPRGDLYVDVEAECTLGGSSYNGYAKGTINVLVDAVPYISTVSNLTASSGGDDGEPYTDEGDERYRDRIRLSPAKMSTAGPEASYIYYAKSADAEIIDVSVTSPADMQVEVVPLMVGGEVPDEDTLAKVLAAVNAPDVRPMCDQVSVKAPTQVPFDINIKYYCLADDEVDTIEAVESTGGAIDQYVDWQITKLGRDINPDQLRRFLLRPDWADNLTGALRVDVTAPAFKQLEKGQVAKFSGSLTVTHEVVQE